MDSRSSTPEAPPQDLWSSILDSVSTSRSIPSKQVVILGQPSSGKSSLASALLQKPPADDPEERHLYDFTLEYDFADVRDDADEDTLARLSVYTIPSYKTAYTNLIPHFLPPKTSLSHTLFMIVLDWTRPWTFVEELETWLEWIESWTQGDKSRELQIAKEENRERLQSYLQHYTEPSTDAAPATTTLTAGAPLLPLGQGTLTRNSSGASIIVVCAKADLIDGDNEGVAGISGITKGKGGEWEDRNDGIMQVLRTICLMYGAALFYTTPQPATLQILRQYALHMLFIPPAPQPGAASAEGTAPARHPFPFPHKSNTLDRDRIVVPAGWDSWGKITVMREFEPKAWVEAWERDLDPDSNEGHGGAKMSFTAFVPDLSVKQPSIPPLHNPTPEQAFLAKHFDESSKKPNDPRGAFRNPNDMEAITGVVGPLGSSSYNLPNVERALTEMESGIGGAHTNESGASRPRGAGRPPTGRPAPLTSPTGVISGRPPPSPNPAGTPISPPSGQTQHEVLQNFFQSLLSNKDRAGAAAAARPKVNGTAPPPSQPPADESTS